MNVKQLSVFIENKAGRVSEDRLEAARCSEFAGEDREWAHRARVDEKPALGLNVLDASHRFDELESDQVVDHPRVGHGREALVAKANDRVDTASPLRHSVDLGESDLEPTGGCDLGQQIGGENRSLPPDAAQHDRYGAHERSAPRKSHAGPEWTIASYLHTWTH